MADDERLVLARGSNPPPPNGWSWSLTDYEVAYVREFSVRPVRDGWEGSAEDNSRLDQEADGARLHPTASVRPRYLLALWAGVAGAIVAVGLAAAVVGLVNVSAAATLNEKTSSIEADL